MYIYHTLINALSAHIIHINLNMIFYTHVKHSPTKTIDCYYVSRVSSFFSDTAEITCVDGSNLEVLRDNLLFLCVEYSSSASVAQQQLSRWCGLRCVPVLRVSSLCHIALCQGQLVTMHGFRWGWSSGFSSIPLSPSSFSIVFAILSVFFTDRFSSSRSKRGYILTYSWGIR